MGIFDKPAGPAGRSAETLSRPAPGRETANVLAAEQLAELRHIAQTFTSFAARLEGRLVNDVLEVATRTIPTAGYIALSYGAAAGAVNVSNPGANTVTVSASGPAEARPTQGIGVYVVPGANSRTVPVASRQITLWGTAGDTVSYIAYAAAPLPVTA